MFAGPVGRPMRYRGLVLRGFPSPVLIPDMALADLRDCGTRTVALQTMYFCLVCSGDNSYSFEAYSRCANQSSETIR